MVRSLICSSGVEAQSSVIFMEPELEDRPESAHWLHLAAPELVPPQLQELGLGDLGLEELPLQGLQIDGQVEFHSTPHRPTTV